MLSEHKILKAINSCSYLCSISYKMLNFARLLQTSK